VTVRERFPLYALSFWLTRARAARDQILSSPWRFLAANLAQKLRHRDDGHAVILMQFEEVIVAGNDIVRMPGLGALKNLVVVRIGLHHI
jgi:hypothetical protein